MFNPEIRKFYDESIGGDALKGAGMGASIGSVVPGVGTLIGAGAGALIGGVTGFLQKKKANQILKQNPYPNQPIPNEVLANQQQAERMADEGTPSAQYIQAQKNIQRQQATAINAAQDRRSGSAAIGGIQEATNNAQGQLDAQSAMARRENQLNLQNVNNNVASWRDKAWDWNQKNKYLQNYQYGMSLLGAGNANMYGAADKLLAAGTQAYGSGLFSGGGGGKTGGTNSGGSGMSGANMGALIGQVAPLLG